MEDGLRVIDLLSRHPSTARFIALKLARRFIADDPPPSVVNKAAEAFSRSDGDIPTVLRTLIDSPEFFSPETYQAKVKKPLEFVASALRTTGAEVRLSHQLLRYLGRMGEPLFWPSRPPVTRCRASWTSPDMLLKNELCDRLDCQSDSRVSSKTEALATKILLRA
jgi:uncharacterized protein (DUF1800 family)